MRFVILALALIPLVARAGCPLPGDLAPGTLTPGSPPTWTITGDGAVTLRDGVVLRHLADGDWVLDAGALTCAHPAGDIAPGYREGKQWVVLGNGAADECDFDVVGSLIVGRNAATTLAGSDPAEVGGGAAEDLRALDWSGSTDDAYLDSLATALESLDGEDRGAEQLRAYLEGRVATTCTLAVTLPPSVETGAPVSYPPSLDDLLARVRATRGWPVLLALRDTATFDGGALVSREPGLFHSLVSIIVRLETIEAWHLGRIDLTKKTEILAALAQNPFQALRLLLQATGQATPAWLLPAPSACMRACVPENCALPGDEDLDGKASCADSDCASFGDCLGPARPGIDDPRTVALLHADGEEGAAEARDESGKIWEGVAAGLPVTTRVAPLFAPGSFGFDGSRGATCMFAPDFDFGTGDFTIDWWANVTPDPSGTHASHRRMITLGSTQLSLQVATQWSSNTGRTGLWVGDGSQWLVLEAVGSTNVLGAWHHFALVRSGARMKVFVDGQPEIDVAIPGGWTVPGEPRVTLGHMANSTDGYLMVGQMDEIRVVKGVAAWTSAFTPPGRHEPPAKAAPDQYTVALLHGENADGSGVVSDETGRLWTHYSGAVTNSAAQARFGGGSLYFGSGPHVRTPATPDFDFGTGDFTLEAWVRFDFSAGSIDMVFGRGVSDQSRFLLYRYTDGLIFYDGATVGNIGRTGLGDLIPNTWHHVAATREGTTFRVFVDGHLTASATHAGAVLDQGSEFWIGNQPIYPYGLKGHLDEVRISKGIARYTADFTPPAAPFPP